jgi:tricorn protease
MGAGYYQFPTIAGDNVIFVSEDDLWAVPASGGIGRRLTSNLALVTRPFLSPDGRHLAFVGREEGQAEIYIMPGVGGQARRLTFMGGSLCQTAGWTSDSSIIFATNAAQPFAELLHLYTLNPNGGQPQQINVGPARAISYGPGGGVVIGRNTGDPARWKRYQGGTAGQIWIDEQGTGEFRPLIELKGNLASPMWIGERIFFLSDHEGVGNIYSCLPCGKDLERHTDHSAFYARNATSDGKRIVYHAGADLYLYDPGKAESVQIQIEFYSPQVQRNRKFVDPLKYLKSWDLHPAGQALAITARGKLFSFANWEGAVLQHGESQGVRYRLPRWLNDGKRLVCLSDEGGEERFAIFRADGLTERELLPELDIGRPIDIAVNPTKDQIAFSNHRYELMALDLESKQLKRIDQGKAARIAGYAWSPDGVWLAYSVSISLHVAVLKIWNVNSGEIYPLTEPVLRDIDPAFDPDGKYLYFLSYRYFNPVYDNLHFDLNFPRGVKPYLITLKKDEPSPFVLLPKYEAPQDEEKKNAEQSDERKGDDTNGEKDATLEEAENEKPPAVQQIHIDLEGIAQRVVEFPVTEGRYGRVRGLKEGKVLYSFFPIEGTLDAPLTQNESPAKGSLWVYKFDRLDDDSLMYGISDFDVSQDASTMIIQVGNHLRVLRAGVEPEDKAGSKPSRQSGWIDLYRVSVPVVPNAEWRQMFREAWRLQRDQFWTPDMSEVDWSAVHDRYLPLVDRVGSRAEFSDLMYEMQGELGTSHCYEMGGDYRPEPTYQTGFLGADFEYDEQSGGWRITKIIQGDPWDEKSGSPLNHPGVNLQVGDCLVALNGQLLNGDYPPAAGLVNLAGREVTLTIISEGVESPRLVTVKTLSNEMQARYREWVKKNRRYVHESTNGRVGYLHIPDMGARGYAEFHRSYLAEVDREGLVVDLRFNGGGNVSPLLLEKLARRRLGYGKQRWGEPMPYPHDSVLGPVVALTNEHAGSDGDIFSHGFKMMKLGPLLGKRTWGGVIGIWPRQALVDGAFTTQPEFSFWFEDVGWGVENYGTDPDIEVDNTPQDYARGIDAQLDRSIQEMLRLMEEDPPRLPDFSRKPSKALPTLPPNKNKQGKRS